MDLADEAQIRESRYLADCLARRTGARIAPRPGGRCAFCGRGIPPARLASGAGTCIECQIAIERGEAFP